MLRGEIDARDAADPEELLAAYEAVLAETVDRLGVGTVADRSGVDVETLEAVAAGRSPDLDLETAAAILAADGDRPDAETVAAQARDVLLLGMTTAVVDVDSLASELDGAFDPKELQQKVEGRRSMTLAEYATIHHHLAEHTE